MHPRPLPPTPTPPAELPGQLTDEELAQLSGEGVDAAFEMLVIRHRQALLWRCAEVVGQTDAEEAVQEALLRAYLALTRGDRVRRVGPWLRAIAHNAALNLLRARATRPAAADPDQEEPRVETDAVEQREQIRLMMGALAALPDRQRDAIVMRELEGRSYAEIEARLETSRGAVRQLLHRARVSMRKRVAGLPAIEPAIRLIMGSAGGGGVARLGALSAGCAVTIKLCASTVLPGALGIGAAPAPRSATAPTHVAASSRAVSLRAASAGIGATVTPAGRSRSNAWSVTTAGSRAARPAVGDVHSSARLQAAASAPSPGGRSGSPGKGGSDPADSAPQMGPNRPAAAEVPPPGPSPSGSSQPSPTGQARGRTSGDKAPGGRSAIPPAR